MLGVSKIDNHRMDIDFRLQNLLEFTGASRTTLRRDVGGDYAFPVTNEACRPGVPSLKEERTIDLRTQPVVLELQKGRQIVQDDCRAAFDDPAFHRMLETYGGLAAQIVTPIFRADTAHRDRVAPSARDATAVERRRGDSRGADR